LHIIKLSSYLKKIIFNKNNISVTNSRIYIYIFQKKKKEQEIK
jgi:hypothetical protein